MTRRRVCALVLLGITACRTTQVSHGSEDTLASDAEPMGGGSAANPRAFSIFPEATAAVDLTAAALNGTLPPSWRVGEAWEVMFCIANQDWTRRGEYDTTRVVFKVVAVPQPGAYSAVVEVKQHNFPRAVWVGEVSRINGTLVGNGSARVVVEDSEVHQMVFRGDTFDSIVPLSHDRYQRPTLRYEALGEHLGTAWIRDVTPHVPAGLHNPEITAETATSFQARSTITPTPDGLVYQVEEGADAISQRTVFWRRGESWWTYARWDAIHLRDPEDADGGEYRAPDGNSSFAWAIKLPPGEPAGVSCNSKP
jgi:hypothetical protein